MADTKGEEKAGTTEADGPRRRGPRTDIQLEKVAAPNKTDFEANQAKLDNGVKAVQQKIIASTKVLEDKAAQRTALREQIKDLVGKLKTIKDQKTALSTERENLQAEIRARDERRTERMQKVTDMRKSLRYGSVDDIDKAIASIDFRLSTTTVSLKTEKDLVNEIKDLKASKEQVRAFQEMKVSIDDPALVTTELRGARDEKSLGLKKLRELENQYQTALRNLRVSENTVNEEIKNLISERRVAQNDMRALKDQLVLQKREFEKAERAYKRYIDQVAYLKRQQRRQEREARESEYRKRKAEEAAEFGPQHPYEIEMFICEELIRYLKRLAPKDPEADESKAAEVDKTAAERNKQFKGADAVPLTKKDDEDIFGTPLPKSSTKPVSKRRSRVRKNNVLTHIPDIFRQFEQIGLVPPLDVDSIPLSLKSLSEKLEYYRTAPPPLSDKEKSDHRRKIEKEKQEKIVSRDLRREEAKERSQLQQLARQMEKDEQWRRLQEYNEVIDEDEAERDQAYNTAVALEEEERARRIQEEKENADEEARERVESRRKSIMMEEEERARRVHEDNEEDEEEARLRETRRKKSIALMEEEQKRRIKEYTQEIATEHRREEEEREDAIARTIKLEEDERQRRVIEEEERIKKEEQDIIDSRKASLARLAVGEEEERKRQIEAEEADILRSQKEEVEERSRRRSLAIQLEDDEQKRRIQELEEEDIKEEQEWLQTLDKVNKDIELERRRQVKEFPEHIKQVSPFVALLAQHPIKPADAK